VKCLEFDMERLSRLSKLFTTILKFKNYRLIVGSMWR